MKQAPTVYQFQVIAILHEFPMLMPDMSLDAVAEAVVEDIAIVELGLVVADMSISSTCRNLAGTLDFWLLFRRFCCPVGRAR